MTQILSDRLLTCRGNKMALPCRVEAFQGVRAVGLLSLGPGHEQEDETDTYSGVGNEKGQCTQGVELGPNLREIPVVDLHLIEKLFDCPEG